METTMPKDELLLIVKTSKNYWSRNSCISDHAREFAIRGIQKALDEVLLKEPKDKVITEDEFYAFVEYAISYWHWNMTMSTIWAQKHIVEDFMRAANRGFDFVEAESAKNKGIGRNSVSRSQTSTKRSCHESKGKPDYHKSPVSVSALTTPTAISRALPSAEKATCVLAPYSPEVDPMVKCAFEVCLVDIFFLPYSCPPLKKTPTKVSAFPLSHAADDLELAEHQDDDSEDDEAFFSRIAKELSSHDDVLSEEEGQVQDLNFIVEGCTFRGDIEIPTPPPPVSEPEDYRASWEREEPPELDDHYYQAPWERDDDIDSRSYLPVGWNNKPSSPPQERYIPSAAFTRSAVEERSNTPPDEFDRYLTESFRPVNKPLLPATATPARDVAAPKAATTGDACAARAAPSVDIVPRRLSYSDVSAIRRAHGERDPDLGAVSDADSRCDDDYGVIPGDWQDQSLYDTELLQHVDASHSPFSSHGGQDSDASSSCGLQPNRDDYSDTSSVQSDHNDSDGCSDVSANCYNEYGDY
jgi:hypothetical protein